MIWLAAGALAALVIVAVLLVVLFVLLFDRLDGHTRRFDAERAQWVAERRELNQRIQAPEIATVEAIDMGEMDFVGPDDDTAFWQDYVGRVTDG